MRNSLFAVFIFMFCGHLLVSCRSLKEPDFKGIDNVRLSSLGFTASTMQLDMHYFNPNKVSLKLKEAAGEAWLDGRHIGRFSIDTLVNIPGNSNFTLPVKLQVDMKKVLKNSLTALFNNEITVKVEGTAKVGKGGLYIRYPIKYEGKQNLDKLLRQNDSLNQNKLP